MAPSRFGRTLRFVRGFAAARASAEGSRIRPSCNESTPAMTLAKNPPGLAAGRTSILNALPGLAGAVRAARGFGDALHAMPAYAVGVAPLAIGTVTIIATRCAEGSRCTLRRQEPEHDSQEDEPRTRYRSNHWHGRQRCHKSTLSTNYVAGFTNGCRGFLARRARPRLPPPRRREVASLRHGRAPGDWHEARTFRPTPELRAGKDEGALTHKESLNETNR
jgi:hypothetical protein